MTREIISFVLYLIATTLIIFASENLKKEPFKMTTRRKGEHVLKYITYIIIWVGNVWSSGV